jgi:RHS repeat-associated protein
MLVIQERNSSNVPLISYARGLDLSGTLAGAGGIGGLLSRSRHATTSPYAINGNSFYHADGNGNVTYLSAASGTGSADAAYKYDPFGRWLAQTGSYATANVMRFSSKPWVGHNGSATDGLYYYGYRFYEPQTQRWPSRDPLGDEAFFRLYASSKSRSERIQLRAEALKPLYLFVSNDPANKYDYLGLQCGITVHRAPVRVRPVWDWPPIEIDAGHEWIEFDGQGYGFWPAGSALYSDGKMHEGDDPHTGERNGRNWDLACKKARCVPGQPFSVRIEEGTFGYGVIYGSDVEKYTVLQAGSGKGKKCPDATCDDIKSCIKAVAAEWKTGKTYCLPATNCRDFVSDVLQRCALNRASQAK